MHPGLVTPHDPRSDDVRALLARHHAFAREHSPPEDVHALDVDALAASAVAFVGCRRDGVLLGVGALTELDPRHGELKSMHTAAEARGQGVARAVLHHLLRVARDSGYVRVSLETGTPAAFAAARSLYAAAGFVPCGPFGAYRSSPWSTFMTLRLDLPDGTGGATMPG
ncbi:GNAT family N-acetyltransferase [Thalassiella azotivora]